MLSIKLKTSHSKVCIYFLLRHFKYHIYLGQLVYNNVYKYCMNDTLYIYWKYLIKVSSVKATKLRLNFNLKLLRVGSLSKKELCLALLRIKLDILKYLLELLYNFMSLFLDWNFIE